METIFELQRWLYTAALEALNALRTTGVAGLLPALIAAAFGFVMLHALLPGHSKPVLASFYAGHGRYLGGRGGSTILILTHVGCRRTGAERLRHPQRTIGGAGR